MFAECKTEHGSIRAGLSTNLKAAISGNAGAATKTVHSRLDFRRLRPARNKKFVDDLVVPVVGGIVGQRLLGDSFGGTHDIGDRGTARWMIHGFALPSSALK